MIEEWFTGIAIVIVFFVSLMIFIDGLRMGFDGFISISIGIMYIIGIMYFFLWKLPLYLGG